MSWKRFEGNFKSFHNALLNQNPSSRAGTFITYLEYRTTLEVLLPRPSRLVNTFLEIKVPGNADGQRADALAYCNSSFSFTFFISKMNSPCCWRAITELVFTYWWSVQMSCDLTYPDVRTLCSAANGDARGGLSATVCIVLRIKTAILSRLRGNILQRGRLRWSRPDRQAGTCHLVEVAGNRTSKNEKWQDIDLLIAAVQTHRCEGQEEGVCGGGGSGYQAFTNW